jgi:hypothetical protein
VLQACAYVLANPVTAGLVRRGREWPGLWSAPEEIGGERRTFGRPKLFFDPRGGMPASASLAFEVPRGFGRAAFRKALAAALEARERGAAKVMKAARTKPLGLRAIKAQSPGDRAAGEEKTGGRRNHLSATDPKKLAEGLERRATFLNAYRAALQAFQAGKRSTRFPPGTYLMRVHLGLVCSGAG